MSRLDLDPQKLRALRYFGSTLTLVLATLILILAVFLWTVRVSSVSGEEVGILLNNLNGKIERLDPGTHIYNGITKSFYKFDKRIQQIEMVAEHGRGAVRGSDELRFKTIDGSNVWLDLTVIYELNLAKLEDVARETGVGDAYKNKWVRDYTRSICRYHFGQLTTEEFYDAAKRTAGAIDAQMEINARLEPHGITITRIAPEKFHFKEEYEAKIKEKKLADQEVEEQESLARAAVQNRERKFVESTKKKEVAIEVFSGQMRELMVTAGAQAERTREEANAYAIKTRIGGEADFYQIQKKAEAVLAQKNAEAEGTRQMAEALKGEGGRNIVKMEYAEKLAQMLISGQPFTVRSQTERFAHTEEAGAAEPVRKAARKEAQ